MNYCFFFFFDSVDPFFVAVATHYDFFPVSCNDRLLTLFLSLDYLFHHSSLSKMALTFLYSTTSFSSSSSLTRRFPNYHFRLRNSPIFLHNWSLSSFLNHSLFITGRIGFVLLIPAFTLLFIFFAAASAAFQFLME